MRRILAPLLLLAASGQAIAAEPAPTVHTFHVRVARGEEVLMERDMVQILYLGSAYIRTWTDFARGLCPGRTLAWENRLDVRLTTAPPPLFGPRPYPSHAVLLSVEAGAPPTVDDCGAAPVSNEVSLSRVLVLEPGRPVRIESGGLVVEITRR
jgi:hypothetical protein